MAEAVVIRPVVEAGLDRLDLLSADPDEAGQFGFFGYQNPGGEGRLHPGFTREGTLRGSCFRAGKWRDMASYPIVRADLPQD